MRQSSFASPLLCGWCVNAFISHFRCDSCMTQTALQMTCCCQLTALLGARLTSSVQRQAVGAGRNSKNEPCVALLFTDALRIPRGLVIGCEPREPEVCPKILQRAVVCASCVHKRKFCVSWRAANGIVVTPSALRPSGMATEADLFRA